MRRLRRWLARGLEAVALVAAALAVASRTGAVRALERRAVVRVLESATGERVTLAGVGGTLGHSLVLEDLRLTAGGRTVVHVPRLEIVCAPLALVHGVVRLKGVTLTAPRVRAVREGDAGALVLPPGGSLPVEIDHLEVTGGRVAVALLDTEPPRRFAATALALAARGRLDPGGAEVEVATLRFVPRGLALAPVAAAGRVTARPGGPVRLRGFHLASGRSRLDAEAELDGTGAIAAHLALAPLAAADVRALAPRSALATDLRARLRMRGPWHALAVRAHADLGRGGGLHARAALDATARPVAYAARLAFARLDPGAVLPWLPRAEASGQLAFRGDGGAHRLRGEVRTPLGEAALQGRLAPGTPPAYPLAARVSLPRLEAFDARAAGAASRWRARPASRRASRVRSARSPRRPRQPSSTRCTACSAPTAPVRASPSTASGAAHRTARSIWRRPRSASPGRPRPTRSPTSSGAAPATRIGRDSPRTPTVRTGAHRRSPPPSSARRRAPPAGSRRPPSHSPAARPGGSPPRQPSRSRTASAPTASRSRPASSASSSPATSGSLAPPTRRSRSSAWRSGRSVCSSMARAARARSRRERRSRARPPHRSWTRRRAPRASPWTTSATAPSPSTATLPTRVPRSTPSSSIPRRGS